MRLLLDTHAFLWFIQGSQNLSKTAKNLIEAQENQKLLSIASLWEMSIKVSIGKLDLGMAIAELVSREVYGNGFEVLAIQANHLDELTKLIFHHKDPFDRLIIAQALAERMPVLTKDEAFGRYPVSILW
ncbi:MAG: type II toxin-antitoxin system VapC family toxin [Thermosynechococcaceae cyanobacterium MS004]|nr:type II toxin-antitoxin system VapC family toxin [Thermosynechococcaceae cyanobacterium MS004]